MSTDQAEDDFLRKLTFPEEDRHLFTAAPWRGGFRWFRSGERRSDRAMAEKEKR